ncbi:MobH family relaxase [Burkholderia anthina]|uniref:MobH family relaxase n=1 Tax=Burkholderia anthina TaxID=179879 RepID=UPI00158C5CA5
MLSLFQRKRTSPSTGSPSTPLAELPKGLTRPEPAASLLATPRRRRLLEHIWQRTSLSRRQFSALYLAPLERYAELVQQFPASEAHHHAWPGGMLDHGLEIVAFALKLRQSHLMPVGITPEAQAAQAEAWTAGTAYAALLHDIGKVAVDLHVEYADGNIWHPWHGPLRKPYRFRYRKDREYRLHGAATGLLYTRILDSDILDWLSDYPDLWSALLYVMAGQYEHAGLLGELVVQADQASVAQALGGDPAKAMTAPRHALQRKLLDGLRHLLRQELKLNQPQASDGWLTQDSLWLVSKTVSDKLRAYLLSQGIDGIPSNNTAVFTVLQDHGIALPTPDGKAIWKATVTSGAGWSHSFTFLRLSPALIWEAAERPEPFVGTVVVEESASPGDDAPAAGPEAATATAPAHAPATASAPPTTESPSPAQADPLADLLSMLGVEETPVGEPPPPEAPILQPTATPETAIEPQPATPPETTPSGEHFMAWLRAGVNARRLIINDAKALVHTVDGTAYLVSPGLFQRYAQEFLQVAVLARQDDVADWQWVQKRFEKLQLHRKQPSGLNIWTCEVTGPRKSRRLHGYLLQDPTCLFDESPPNNPYLSLQPQGTARTRQTD